MRPLLHAVTPPAHLADLSTRARRPRRTASSSSSASTLSRASVPASSRSPRPRPRLRPSSSTARTAVLPPRTATLAGTTRSSSSPAAPACPSARPSSRRSAAGSCARRRASGSRRSTCGGLSGTRVRALSCRPRPRRARLTRSLALARRGKDVVRQPDPPRDRVPAPGLRRDPPVRHRRAAVGRVEGETRPGGRAVAALQRRRQVRPPPSYPLSLLTATSLTHFPRRPAAAPPRTFPGARPTPARPSPTSSRPASPPRPTARRSASHRAARLRSRPTCAAPSPRGRRCSRSRRRAPSAERPRLSCTRRSLSGEEPVCSSALFCRLVLSSTATVRLSLERYEQEARARASRRAPSPPWTGGLLKLFAR